MRSVGFGDDGLVESVPVSGALYDLHPEPTESQLAARRLRQLPQLL